MPRREFLEPRRIAVEEHQEVGHRPADDDLSGFVLLEGPGAAAEKFAGEMLAVKDSLEAALASPNQDAEALKGGVELTLKQLIAAFERSNVTEINPLEDKFDPHKHQAISQLEADGEPNRVINVLQKGYALHERILRPALVIVAKAKVSDGGTPAA